jgi:hypothetical protein
MIKSHKQEQVVLKFCNWLSQNNITKTFLLFLQELLGSKLLSKHAYSLVF